MSDAVEEIRKLRKRVDKLERQNKAFKKRLRTENSPEMFENSGVGRRSFMKKLGAGIAGFGLLASGAAGKVSITENDVLANGSSLWRSGFSQSFDVQGQSIVDGGTTVWDSTAGYVPASAVQTAGLDADTVDGLEASEIGSTPTTYKASASFDLYKDVGDNGTDSGTLFDKTLNNTQIGPVSEIYITAYTADNGSTTVTLELTYTDDSTNTWSVTDNNNSRNTTTLKPWDYANGKKVKRIKGTYSSTDGVDSDSSAEGEGEISLIYLD